MNRYYVVARILQVSFEEILGDLVSVEEHLGWPLVGTTLLIVVYFDVGFDLTLHGGFQGIYYLVIREVVVLYLHFALQVSVHLSCP